MKSNTILCDANILIDYYDAGKDCLRSICRYAAVMVPDVVLSEVRQVDVDAAGKLGITIVETPLEILSETQFRNPGCSLQDTVCFLLARENEWICATNDGKLRKLCSENGVATVRGLRLLADVVAAGFMSRVRAKKAATRIAAINREITTGILEDFMRLLDEE